MNQHLNRVYKDLCCDTIDLAANKPDEFGEVYQKAQKAFESLFDAKSYKPEDLATNKSYKALINQTAKLLDTTILDNVKGKGMQEALKKDVFLFSGLRTHAQLDQASRLLTDSKGNFRSFDQFAHEFNKINKLYNQNYLSAEYNYAVTVTQTIDRWQNFDDDEERYWLQFRTAMDDKVRDSHASLQGTTLPKNDPFWDEYIPPLDWNCRCQVVEVLASDYTLSDSKAAREEGERATTRIGKDGSNKASIFRFNPAKEKVVFPEKHPYKPQHCKGSKLNMSGLIGYGRVVLSAENDRCKAKKVIENLRLQKDYAINKVGKGTVAIHQSVTETNLDFKNVKTAADYFAKEGTEVIMHPKFDSVQNEDYQKIYASLKDTPYWGKCPDLWVDGKWYEHEGFRTDNFKRAYKNMMKRGLEQSDRIIIEDCGHTDRYMRHNIIGRIKKGQVITEVWIRRGSKLELIYKKQ